MSEIINTLTRPILKQVQLLMLKYSIFTHKLIAIVSFLALSSVQFFLLYNTYELKDEHYFLVERNLIKSEYSYAIRNDKLMPGGEKILDSYINGNMKELEWLYEHDTAKFNSFKQKICDSAFAGLKKANNVDSLLNSIVKANNLSRNLQYGLLIQSIEVTFPHNKYITLYNANGHYPLIDPAMQTKDGIFIGGALKDVDRKKNLVAALIVSSPADYSYRISFDLYVDTFNRRSTILRLMMPTFTLSLLSILFVVLLFFITLRNWIKQKKLSEMKSDFINSITHEFHTPLAAIIVANKTMQNEKIISSKESLRPLTEVVQRQAERLKMLIGEVLQITTLNKISLRKEVYSIHPLLDEVLLDYRLKLTGTNIKFLLKKEAQRDEVQLDRFWFTTILLNLFDNGVKYNNKESREITVTTSNDKKGINISILDNGPGMTGEVQRHIFEKFYRNNRHVNEQVKGLGLGLFYVKQAIDAHNWKIDIESIEGAGSNFIISIPL